MKAPDSLWVVIHMAQSAKKAEAAMQILQDEGFMAKIRPLSQGDPYFEVLVLQSEAREARDLIVESALLIEQRSASL